VGCSRIRKNSGQKFSHEKFVLWLFFTTLDIEESILVEMRQKMC